MTKEESMDIDFDIINLLKKREGLKNAASLYIGIYNEKAAITCGGNHEILAGGIIAGIEDNKYGIGELLMGSVLSYLHDDENINHRDFFRDSINDMYKNK